MADGISQAELDDAWRDLTDWFSVLWPDPTRNDDVYQAQRFFYSDWPRVDDPLRNRDLYGEVSNRDLYGDVSDTLSTCTIREAHTHG